MNSNLKCRTAAISKLMTVHLPVSEVGQILAAALIVESSFKRTTENIALLLAARPVSIDGRRVE